MAPYIVCNKCGMKGLKKYKMVLMHGKNGFRRYSVCEECAGGSGKKAAGEKRKAEGGRATPPPTPPQMDERHLGRGEPTL